MHHTLPNARVENDALVPHLVEVPVDLDLGADRVDVVGCHLECLGHVVVHERVEHARHGSEEGDGYAHGERGRVDLAPDGVVLAVGVHAGELLLDRRALRHTQRAHRAHETRRKLRRAQQRGWLARRRTRRALLRVHDHELELRDDVAHDGRVSDGRVPLSVLGREGRVLALPRRELDANGLVGARRRPKDVRHERDRPQRDHDLGRVLAVRIGNAIHVVEVEEYRWPRLDVAQRGERAALGLHERTKDLLAPKHAEHRRLDDAALEVVLLTSNLEVDWDRHHLGRRQLVHKRAHISRAKVTMPQEQHHVVLRRHHASHPDDRSHVRQLLQRVVHAAQVEERGRLADVHRLRHRHLVVRLRRRVIAPRALDDLGLVHRDAPQIDVHVPLLDKDRAVRR